MPIVTPGEGWVDLGSLEEIITPRWSTWNTTTTTRNDYLIWNGTATTGNWNYQYAWNTNMWSSSTITVRDEDWYTVGYETPDPHPVTDADIAAAIVSPEDREIERAASIARRQYLDEERERQIRSDRASRAVARATATERATDLLLQLLSEEQAEQYRLTGTFEVIGSAGNVYRVNRGISGNIEWIRPDGQVGARLCAHPEMRHGWLPEQDVALAQMLALTTDEPAFIQKANVHAGVRPPIGV